MRYYKFFIVFFLTITSLKCANKIEKKVKNLDSQENTNDTIFEKSIIVGKSDDSLALRYINIMNNAYLFGKDYEHTKRFIIGDSIYIEVDSISKPQPFDLVIFGKPSLFQTRVFLYPGDTVSFKIKNNKINFYGKNAAYSNFFSTLEENTSLYRKNPYQGNIYEYKKKVKGIYDERVKYLNQFIKDNPFASNQEVNHIRDILKFEYLCNLIQPRTVFVESANWYVSTTEGVLSVLNEEYEKQELVFNLNDYLDNVSISDMQRLDLLNTGWFKNALDAYIRYYFANTDHLNYSKEAFLEQKKFIQENFEGELQHYAIARMMREYNIRGFGFSKENIKILKNTMDEYDSIFSAKPSYKEKMDEIRESLDNFNFRLSDEALNLTKLINPLGDTITLQEIFNDTPKKIKVIDFWASWCPPCIREIKKVKNFRNKLSYQENVEWIYLSIDENKQKWLKATNDLQEFLNTEHQYIVVGGKNSSLGKALKVSGIPRYVILDKQDQIILDNAPRPSDSLVFKKVIDDLNNEN